MKKGESGEFSAKWWKSSQPKGLSSGGKLELTLRAYEAGLGKLKASPGEEAKDSALDLLDQVEQASAKVVAEAGKAKANAEMAATVQALGKLDFKKERREVEAMAGDEEEGGIADPEEFKAMLRKGLRKLATGPQNFGFVVGKTAVDHRMVLARSKGGRSLAAGAAKEMNLTVFTFGSASASEDKPNTILLNLEGKQLPGLAKKMKRMLRLNKPLPFGEVVMFVDGLEVMDLPDPEDADIDEQVAAGTIDPAAEIARLRAEMQALVERIRAAAVSAPDQRLALSEQSTLFRSAIGKVDVGGASGALAAVREVLEAIEGRGQSGAGHDGSAHEASPAALGKSRQIWNATRQRLEDDLNKLRAELEKEFSDDEALGTVVQAFDSRVEPVLGAFDPSLSATLDQAAAAADPEQRSKLMQEAKDILGRSRAFLASESLIGDLDSNPFVPLAIQKTMSATLTALEATLR